MQPAIQCIRDSSEVHCSQSVLSERACSILRFTCCSSCCLVSSWEPSSASSSSLRCSRLRPIRAASSRSLSRCVWTTHHHHHIIITSPSHYAHCTIYMNTARVCNCLFGFINASVQCTILTKGVYLDQTAFPCTQQKALHTDC